MAQGAVEQAQDGSPTRVFCRMPGFSKLKLSTVDHHAAVILQQFASLRSHGILCDCVLCLDDREFPIHKAVLAACSPYFQAMFTTQMKEGASPKVAITGVPLHVFEILLDFVYSGEIQLDEANILDVFSAAELLQIQTLHNVCCDYFINQLCVSNCLGIWKYVTNYHCPQLIEAAWSYIASHFTDVACTEEFLGLSKADVCEILSSSDLEIDSEMDVCRAMHIWIMHDIEERSADILDLLACVRLPLLNSDSLSSLANTSQLVSSNKSCKEALIQAKNARRLRSTKGRQKRSLYKKESFTHRKGKRSLAVIGGYCAGFVDQTEVFSERENSWVSKDLQMSSSGCRYFHWVGLIGMRLYAIAGDSLSKMDRVLSKLTSAAADLLQSTALSTEWEYEATLPQDCSGVQVCVLNECLYMYGETLVDQTIVYGISCYNPSSGVWEFLSCIPQARVHAGFVSHKGRLYLAGGMVPDTGEIVNNFDSYDPSTKSWDSLTSCTTGRYHVGTAVLDEHLYLVGGIGNDRGDTSVLLASVEQYSFKSKQWSCTSSLSVPRSGMVVQSWRGKIFAIGGETRDTLHSQLVEQFDPTTGIWVLAPILSCGRIFPSAIVL